MIQTQLRLTLTYKKILVLLGALLLSISTCSLPKANAIEFGEIEYNNALIDYSKIDSGSTLKLADFYFNKAVQSSDNDEKKTYFQKASGEYFILSKIQPDNLYPLIQLARVYDLEGQDRYSKAYFFQALKIDKNNPSTNFYFGDYFLYRKEYTKALHFYNNAFEHGYKETYDILLRMAIVYEKLGDLLRANQYYKKAFLAKPENVNLPEKIKNIEALRYQNTGYYKKKRINK